MIDGKPRVEEGALVLEDGAEVMRRVASADFELRGSLKILGAEKPAACIAFRRPDAGRAGLSRLLFHYDGDVHLRDAELRVKCGPNRFLSTAWSPFLLGVRGGEITLQINGRPVLKGPASHLDPGNLALYPSTKGMSAAFKDLRLREIR